jgi:6-phosphofructokinase 1
MARPRRIGILTGGGDVPGLNSVIKSVVYRSTDLGFEVVGIRRGWEGLTHMRRGRDLDPEYLRRLDRQNTRAIDRTGGTTLHTSRTNPRQMRLDTLPPWVDTSRAPVVDEGIVDLTDIAIANIEHLGLDYLVSIGGDDTLSFATVLARRGVPIVGIPKTMDNDVAGTEYCIGFSSAITRARELINRQRTTLGSHERIGVFRIFGRDAGFSALYAAYVTSARCVIPEHPYDLDALCAILREDRSANPSRYAVVITAEGAIWQGAKVEDVGDPDAFGHRHKENIGEVLAREVKRRTGFDAVSSELTYDLRSGEPDMLDAMVAATFANVAMDLIRAGITGQMAAIIDGKYSYTPLTDGARPARRVNVATEYDTIRFRPKYADRLGDPLLLTHREAAVSV